MTAETARAHVSLSFTHRWLVVILTLAAFGLRLVRLGADSLWYDETVSVYLAGQRVPELIAHTARDIHPPGYYLLLRGWLTLAGYPTGHADPTGFRLEFVAAFLSLVFGVLLVPLTWQLARRLRLGDAAAAIAALLVAISPFGVWYSQEVRMYTLGAALGVVCLLAAVPFVFTEPRRRLWRAVVVFALAGAAGLYTLYYFAFLLVSINLAVLALLLWRLRGNGRAGLQTLALWLAAQLGALLLFVPWLPAAWRQATDPPVPPWRTQPQLLSSIVESWGALSFGQSAAVARFWPLFLLTLALVIMGVVALWRAKEATNTGRIALVLLVAAAFGPLALILLASAATPLYHGRYVFTYWPAFSILLALGIAELARWRGTAGRVLAAGALLLILAGSALSLRTFWTDLELRADDHRAAVRQLAGRWRPGDAILVNAGYAYPPLLTYWTGPSIGWLGRLTDLDDTALAIAQTQPIVVETGHVDGTPDLGWGDPRSDFFALPVDEMRSQLARMSAASNRLWQYRIYDTVNDPQGDIRAALEDDGTLIDDRVYAGEANLRVQLWQGIQHLLSAVAPVPVATFDGWLTVGVLPGSLPEQVTAGQSLDVTGVRWFRPAGVEGQDVAVSLRLVDGAGEVWAAHDEALGGNVLTMAETSQLAQPLHLDIPAGTPPLTHDLTLVVYDPATGQPLPVSGTSALAGSGSVVLGQVSVQPAAATGAGRPLANFGPLQLVDADSPAGQLSPGDGIPVELLWQTGDAAPAEPLVVVLQLVDRQGNLAASLEEEPLQGRLPTADWASNSQVLDRHRLAVPDTAIAGDYSLIVGLYRAGDHQRLTTPGGLFGQNESDHAVIKQIEIR